MGRYRQLSLEEREKLFGYKKQGLSLREIGKKLKRSDTTIGRELKRNAKYGDAYIPCKANKKAKERSAKQRREASWKGPKVYLSIREGLSKHWSPEQIVGRYCLEHPKETLSTETIYQTIYAKRNKKQKLWTKLALARKKRMKKFGRTVHRDGSIPEAISIDKRPKIVARRKQAGHWESDNMIGKVTDKTALSNTVERSTRVAFLSKVDRTADAKTQAIFTRLSVLPDDLLRTMTEDNGKENVQHKEIKRGLGMNVYFCHAYHSWEKGSVENSNGRVRRFIPKGVSIDCIDEKEIARVEWILNNTPRKCLGFETPYEKLQELLTNGV